VSNAPAATAHRPSAASFILKLLFILFAFANIFTLHVSLDD
jgi:hypothetical protein